MRTAWLVAAALLCGCASDRELEAQLRNTARTEVARRPAQYTNGEARAWLVRQDGVERGLLWGTIHVRYGGDTVLPAPIRARFYDAADLTVESLIDRPWPHPPQAEAATAPPDLRKLDASTRQALDQMLPDGSAERLSLRGIARLVQARASAEAPGLMPNVGFVDLNLIAFARAQDRPVLSLEEPHIVDPTLDDPNGPDAAGLLRLNLRRADTMRAMGAWVLSTYGSGDAADALAALVAWRARRSDLARSDRDRVALFTRRTANWVPELEATFKRPGFHFVAVGVGHLVGQDGLVSLLRARGFEVLPCLGDAC